MPDYLAESPILASADALYAWHARPGALTRLAPPWQTLRIVDQRGTIHDGDLLTFQVKQGPLWMTWVAEHGAHELGRQFQDVQRRGPFARWTHTHRFDPINDQQSILRDQISYTLPLAPLSEWVAGWAVRDMLDRMFHFRHERTMNDVQRHQKYADRRAQTIAITGASGLIGSALSAFLTTGGHTVIPLVREQPTPEGALYWRPDSGEIEAKGLEGVDVVIHLAGAGVADKRWDEDHKEAIMASRREGTRLLAQTLASLKRKPRVLISASAIGIYGDQGALELDEASRHGDDFLAQVCEVWEREAQPARDAGIRVVHPRIGLVLASQGGLLKPMLTPFKAGVGGKLGDGQQYMSWIALEDVLGAILHLIFDERAEGPFNLTAPQPVTNEVFTKTLGDVLNRPTFMTVPAFAMKAAMGKEMANATALTSQRALPQALKARGFAFLYPELEGALRHELARPK